MPITFYLLNNTLALLLLLETLDIEIVALLVKLLMIL